MMCDVWNTSLFVVYITLMSFSLSVVIHVFRSEGKPSLLTSRSRQCWVKWGKMPWLTDIRTLYHRFEYICLCSLVLHYFFILQSSDWLVLISVILPFFPFLSSSHLLQTKPQELSSFLLPLYLPTFCSLFSVLFNSAESGKPCSSLSCLLPSLSASQSVLSGRDRHLVQQKSAPYTNW